MAESAASTSSCSRTASGLGPSAIGSRASRASSPSARGRRSTLRQHARGQARPRTKRKTVLIRAPNGRLLDPPPQFLQTIEVAAERFLAQYVRRNLKPATISEVERILTKEIIPAWRGRRLSEIGRGVIHNLLDDIVERGAPVTANRTLAWFRLLCSWAVERGLVDSNPCGSIKRPVGEVPRDRVLSDGELVAVWRASAELEVPYGAFTRLLILTGARRNEVANMSWGEIDFEKVVWTLPAARAKNGREHQVPLSDSVADILRALPRVAGSEFVFTLSGRNPITGFSLIKGRLDEAMPDDVRPWTLHDLRRTFATGLARLGIAVHVTEAALNHRSGSIRGVAAIYNRHDYATEKRMAMATWARFVDSLVTGETTGNIVQMRGVQ